MLEDYSRADCSHLPAPHFNRNPGPPSSDLAPGSNYRWQRPLQGASPTIQRGKSGSVIYRLCSLEGRSHPQAGLTSPALRLRATISRSESPLTTDISRSLSSVPAKCSLVASMALNGTAMATLKYRNAGGPKPGRPTHRASSEAGTGIVSCTTQPAGDALSVMHRHLRYFIPPSQERSRC